MNPWGSFQVGRLLVIAGIIFVAIGLILMLGPKLPFLGLGRLPGDIAYKGKSFQFYFPIVSCLILSIMLTLVLWVISVLTRR